MRRLLAATLFGRSVWARTASSDLSRITDRLVPKALSGRQPASVIDVCEKLWSILDRQGTLCLADERFSLCKEAVMAWTKPEFLELRFGFEVTMYIWNR
jgi:coenzyme PQQ precursor peptide PqqA